LKSDGGLKNKEIETLVWLPNAGGLDRERMGQFPLRVVEIPIPKNIVFAPDGEVL